MLDGFNRAKQGRGQAVSILSEAGVGKSRLLYEFRKAVGNENATFLEGKCLSYSRRVAYHPVIDILKSNFDIHDDDDDTGITEKVKKGLKIIDVDEASISPYLLELLSVQESGVDRVSMSPQGIKERVLEALKRIVIKGAETRPLIMAVEDLHWSDKSSEDYFRDVLETIPGAKVLLIFTYRPEYIPTWNGKSYHSQIKLNRLPTSESLAMLSNIFGSTEIERNLKNIILEKQRAFLISSRNLLNPSGI